jgi:hypothetical protein
MRTWPYTRWVNSRQLIVNAMLIVVACLVLEGGFTTASAFHIHGPGCAHSDTDDGAGHHPDGDHEHTPEATKAYCIALSMVALPMAAPAIAARFSGVRVSFSWIDQNVEDFRPGSLKEPPRTTCIT